MRNWKKICSFMMIAIMTVSMLTVHPAEVYADVSGGYLSLGADLTDDERAAVLELLGVSEDDLDNYQVVYVTNAEEHDYLDSYIEYSKIGDEAWSSVLITEAEKGSGIHVTTKNVTYCTTGMYENALSTAGVDDVDVIVAGPFHVSGTAALVGALKAYSEMTGEDVDEEVIDAAIDEMVTTGELEDNMEVDDEQVEGLVAYLKEQVASGNAENLDTAIDEAADKFNITLTEDQFNQLKALLEKLGSLDLDLSSLKNQAQAVYDKLGDMGFDLSDIHIDTEEVKSWWDQLVDFFKGLFS